METSETLLLEAVSLTRASQMNVSTGIELVPRLCLMTDSSARFYVMYLVPVFACLHSIALLSFYNALSLCIHQIRDVHSDSGMKM